MANPPWKPIAEYYQASRDAAIPTEWLLPSAQVQELKQAANPQVINAALPALTPSERDITALDATELAARIRQRTLSCVAVADAFCHRAAIAQQLTNCLTEVFFHEALARARELDEILDATGRPVGPLHGVPVSVKDHYNVRGHPTTAGYIAYAKNGSTTKEAKDRDAHIVDIMRRAGAVLYAKTNNPQCMMVLETVSNIYGRTLNPRNLKLGAGGSSGGEAALVAQRGSPLGIGSDIGGSIRVPAAFNGVYGFKPSGKRVPTGGWECTNLGAESITAVAGPIACSVRDLDLFMQITADARPWLREPLLAMPWRSRLESSSDPLAGGQEKLKVGVMRWDEVVMPHPCITRVLDETAEKLRQAGHQVFDFEPYDHKRAWDEILLPLYFTDGGKDIKSTLEAGQEEMLPCASELIHDPIVRERSVHEIWKLNIARDQYRSEYLQRWAETAKHSSSTSEEKPMDVLICPAAPILATPHDVKPWWGYGALWNLLDFPSGVLPAGEVLAGDAYPDGYQPVSELDRKNAELWDNSAYLGMPVAIQVVGLTHEDEAVVGTMGVIDRLVNA
ncbi:Amidase [Cordyceps fumosorosea ARSEF 2679]|uniref:amidase n=1 Tax=Cordyceps fumosorosea (strain ARSEF 2679) TaxID=1081104 RepID=A0A167N612_CORFA|nr:Amidase [Cordyceps fumosorosea ARSEF 2679]OAA55169.1 Amidase [Cordyceps fumosorosea ARSEF 2679]